MSKERVKKNLISGVELVVLNLLKSRADEEPESTSDVSEISASTGIEDNDEVWRALYSLEGKCLVRPHPEGDFTSHHWRITDVGKKAFGLLAQYN